MLDELVKAVDHAVDMGAEYAEARFEDVTLTSVVVKDAAVTGLSSSRRVGLCVRVLVHGAWGFSSSSGRPGVDEVVESAVAMARALSARKREVVKLSEVKASEDRVAKRVRVSPLDIDIADKVSRLVDLSREIASRDSRVVSTTVRYSDSLGKKLIVTSEGTRLEIDILHVWQYVWATGKDGVRAAARDEVGSVDEGLELFDHEANDIVAERVLTKLDCQLRGVPAKRGSFPIVAAPIVVGVIAHEALGHMAEADLTQSSAFRGRLGERVAPEFVNMSDYPRLRGGFGNITYDDEGVRAKKVEIIKGGVLSGLMTNREYAAKFGLPPSGSARAESYSVPPLIRMRNTVFERGDMSFDELLEGIKFGYYLVDFRGGQANYDSTFQLGIQHCYEIVDGEVGRPVRDASISGIAVEALKLIEGVGKDFGLECGRCGKWQSAFVSSGGPHLRFAEGAIVMGGAE